MSMDEATVAVPNQESPEQRFLAYARTGDKAIIRSLIQEYANRSYNQARRIIGQDEGAEDAVQEAYLLLVSTAQRYDGSVPFSAWLGRLIMSTSVDYRRNTQRHKHHRDITDPGIAAMKEYQHPESVNDSPEMEALRQALDALPDHYRAPLTLYYFGGLNQHETAKALGAPAGTIAKQLSRGLEHLREKLGRAGFAITTAGLLALFASVPTYAATPEFRASLTASSRLLAVANAKGATLASGSLLAKAGIGGALAVAVAAGLWMHDVSSPNHESATLVSIAPSEAAGLIGHWTFDEAQGTSAIDSSGNGNVGVLVHEPKRVPGKRGGALQFNGVDNYVRIPSSVSLNSIKEELTLAFWVHKNAETASFGTLVGRRTGPQFDDIWNIIYTDDAPEEYLFSVTTVEQGEQGVYGPNSDLDRNAWVHLACAYDGTESRFYHNGTLVARQAAAGHFIDESTPLMIGASDSGTYGIAEHVAAAIDDVRVYNRALTDAEIAVLAR